MSSGSKAKYISPLIIRSFSTPKAVSFRLRSLVE